IFACRLRADQPGTLNPTVHRAEGRPMTETVARTATMDKVAALCKRRGYVFPGSDIYGGLANTWDYGPLGAELRWNIKRLWWRTFVHRRRDMVGLDGG